ncbi:MAG: type II toxin-antitoxin system Phd/YefM family antitoxin [Bacteroidetes bacterium]|nr:type II toxin-antitoxin system Phd/YefM family antitoxin [Bacteroidota bacterium]MCH7772589.1 type II toxin-antitoxin system Phd/YefM family antitoxin [Bacteroidota bacterium]
MIKISIQDAKINFLTLVEKVINGEEVVITKNNKPIVKLVLPDEFQKIRRIGTAKGKVTIPDDFDEPLTDFINYC